MSHGRTGPLMKPGSRPEQAAGVAGLVFSALLIAGLVAFGRIGDPAGSEDVLSWYSENYTPVMRIVGLYIIPFAGIAFMWFMAALRERGGSKTDRFFDTVFLGSGFIFVATLFGGSAALLSVTTADQFGPIYGPTEDTIQMARSLGFAFFNVYAARSAGVFTMVTAGTLMRSGFFPRWVGLVSLPVALILLLATGYFKELIYVFPVWVAFVSATYLLLLAKIGSPDDVEPKDA
jgi:hypothetical protein